MPLVVPTIFLFPGFSGDLQFCLATCYTVIGCLVCEVWGEGVSCCNDCYIMMVAGHGVAILAMVIFYAKY